MAHSFAPSPHGEFTIIEDERRFETIPIQACLPNAVPKLRHSFAVDTLG
ncbi:unnamed protein product [Tuwongella immobilis]|uniref:Uncharacterized protein n=1 Tax=Tuwongella immobilis TaxID=692036 RepID=A0A6C2YN73_9BACT|nr:unnamed protein product [Tuwongella immobilis]VTS01808.1 unnamed protein product [Tuwongella immobilis]